MIKVLVDTDVLIDYSKGHDQLLGVLLEKQDDNELELWVNLVILAEFFSDKNLRDKNKFARAVEFTNLFRVAEIGKKIGLLAGKILREEKVNFIGDALITATCVSEKLLLATGNKKHFSNEFSSASEPSFYEAERP